MCFKLFHGSSAAVVLSVCLLVYMVSIITKYDFYISE